MTITKLAPWYREHGRHALPWRASRDRWTVLVSEVMLHQTQVPRVASVFDAFMGEFPIEGVQFHPESILTDRGHELLANFLTAAGAEGVRAHA